MNITEYCKNSGKYAGVGSGVKTCPETIFKSDERLQTHQQHALIAMEHLIKESDAVTESYKPNIEHDFELVEEPEYGKEPRRDCDYWEGYDDPTLE